MSRSRSAAGVFLVVIASVVMIAASTDLGRQVTVRSLALAGAAAIVLAATITRSVLGRDHHG